MQALRGMAEGITGPFYRHRKDTSYNHHLFFKATQYPENFTHAKVNSKEDFNMMSITQWSKDVVMNFAKLHRLHRQVFAYLLLGLRVHVPCSGERPEHHLRT